MSDGKLIYAVDDEENIRELYGAALKSAGFDCACFPDGESMFSALQAKKPALIILDIMLDGADGYAILQRLKDNAATRDIPVIMVSAKGEEMSKVKGLNAGAHDYIAKPFGVLELVARVNANLRKSGAGDALCYADIKVDESKHAVDIGDRTPPLTLKEYELLKLLVAAAPNVVTRDKMINTVWGVDYMGETRTLDIHIAALRKALGKSIAAIHTVRGVGYYLK